MNCSFAASNSGRQRWMVREVDADSGEATTSWQFTDYSGQQPYLDYDVEFDFEADPPTADAYDSMRYLDGATVHAQQAASNGAARYYHGDLTGSTNALTDTSGAMLTGGTTTNGGPFYYTSFGERVYYDSGSSSWKLGGEFPIGSPRYLYDGGHGYEAGHLALSGANASLAPITFQHVGERWYQPEIGRFVQRDPIGLGGGINCYVYLQSNPVVATDSMGLVGDNELCLHCGRLHCMRHMPPPVVREMSPERELVLVKKDYFIKKSAQTVIGGCVGFAVGGPLGTLGAILIMQVPDVIDEVITPDEPLNPLHGGRPEDWRDYYSPDSFR